MYTRLLKIWKHLKKFQYNIASAEVLLVKSLQSELPEERIWNKDLQISFLYQSFSTEKLGCVRFENLKKCAINFSLYPNNITLLIFLLTPTTHWMHWWKSISFIHSRALSVKVTISQLEDLLFVSCTGQFGHCLLL